MPSATAIVLLILLGINMIYFGHYESSFLVVAGVCIFRLVSWWYFETRAMNNKSPNPVIFVKRSDQQQMMERLASASPMIATSSRHRIIKSSSNPSLDAIVTTPKKSQENSNGKICFVLTHPWAPLGGDMHNNVPVQVSEALATYGYTTIRFNFRGVGKSSGCCTWRGHGERNDLKSVCEWILSDKGPDDVEKIILIGYSYGSMISNSCADMMPEIKAFVSIATPFPCYWGLSLFNCSAFMQLSRVTSKPKLFLCGDEDDFTGSRNFKKYTKSFPSENKNKSSYLIQGVDHSWYGTETVAAAIILRFLKEQKLL